MVLDRRGEKMEERMLDFTARVGKVVDAIPETRLLQPKAINKNPIYCSLPSTAKFCIFQFSF